MLLTMLNLNKNFYKTNLKKKHYTLAVFLFSLKFVNH